MKFCEKCGNLLIVKKKVKHTYLICRNCGKEFKMHGERIKVSETIRESKKRIIVMKKEGISEFPTTKTICPKCENGLAYWWMQQTRSADEPPTLFYKCTKCGYAWRSYD